MFLRATFFDFNVWAGDFRENPAKFEFGAKISKSDSENRVLNNVFPVCLSPTITPDMGRNRKKVAR